MNAEDIVIKYDSSIIVRRWAAVWIDFIALFGILLLAQVILGDEIYRKTLAIWVGILIAYFPILEGLTGVTAGKFILRIKVVDSNCKSPGIGKAIIRTLLKIIEVNPFLLGGLPAGIIALFSKKKQRLGDMLAKTYVVKIKDIQNAALADNN